MMKKHYQNGFGHLGLLLIVVIVALIGLIGYKVWHSSSNTVQPPASTTSQNGQAINTTADLNNAESSLNNANIDGDLNPDSLNQDVQTLL
jgi:predicted negative regulator of RcsB-dependent stress response